MEIDSLDDFICNIKELMKQYFYPTEDVDDLIESHKHEIPDVNQLQSSLDNKANINHSHPIDDEIKNSINPVQNKVIKEELEGKADILHSHPIDSALSSTSTNPLQNKAINSALNNKADSSHSHSNASASINGFMSSDMFNKLKNIEENANKTVIDSKLSSTSTNPVQNKAINTALNNKADKNVATTSANGLMSSADKLKLDAITSGAKARKKMPGLYISSPKDGSNQGLITIDQGTRLRVCLYDPELGNIDEGWNDSFIIPNTTIHYTINGANRDMISGGTFGANLNPGTYDVNFSFFGSGNYYPLYRTIKLRID